MPDSNPQIPTAADDPWAQFPDADASFLNGPSTRSSPPQLAQSAPQFALNPTLNLTAGQRTVPVTPGYAPAPDLSASQFGMFGRGSHDVPTTLGRLGTYRRDASALRPFDVSPYFRLRPDFAPPNLDLGRVAVRAPTPPWAFTDDKGNNVGVVGSDGWATVRNNGSAGTAWRDNNPGNMQPDAYTRKWGQVGANRNSQSSKIAGAFAIMPDEQNGWHAMIDKLTHSKGYAGPDLDIVLRRWVYGPNAKLSARQERELAKYISDVRSFTGWPNNIKYDQTDPQMVETLARAIKRRDGWHEGEIDDYNMSWPFSHAP